MKLCIVSQDPKTLLAIESSLIKIFGSHATIITNLDNAEFEASMATEFLFIFTNGDDAGKFMKNFPEATAMVLHRQVQTRNLGLLLDLPTGFPVMAVNNSQETTLDFIQQLKAAGITHLAIEPYWPGMETIPQSKVAVTPGERQIVPVSVERIIDLGNRQVTIKSVINILHHFKALDINFDIISRLLAIEADESAGLLAGYSKAVRSILNAIVGSFEESVFVTDTAGIIRYVNQAGSRLLGLDAGSVLGRTVESMFPGFPDKLLHVGNEDYLVERGTLRESGPLEGFYLIFRRSQKVRSDEETIRIRNSRDRDRETSGFSTIIGKSRQISIAVQTAAKMSCLPGTVLIEGESGTGKELFARAIHYTSERCRGPFVPVNFGAMNPSMLESELFGYEGGSFTGARREGKIGLFELAKGGTIFLDEVGDANLELQKHLLRVLQDKRIRRIGGLEQIPVDVRVIAATNRPLFTMVKEGTFRADLFYRIAVLPLTVPPLRERIGDIPILLGYFIEQKSRSHEIAVTELLSERALTFLEHYSWPGNVRELINVVEYLVGLFSKENPADYDELPYFIKESIPLSPGSDQSSVQRHWILETLYYRGGAGRRKLEELAVRANLGLNGNRIRALLRELELEGYVKALKGAGGTILTQAGLVFLGKEKCIPGDTSVEL